MKTSVLMITYNHEKYIEQAIKSVLMQQVNFTYELVIGEDCSTDNTIEIIESLQDCSPDKIKVLSSKRNLGMQRNFVRTYNACEGEYIAVLEGDDYWISAHKLQRQVEFLDTHPECSMCAHEVAVVSEDGSQELNLFPKRYDRKLVTIEDVLSGLNIRTCSFMFRKSLIPKFPDWLYEIISVDWALAILNAQHGKICLLDEKMAAYRIHPKGVWTGMSVIDSLQSRIKTLETFNNHLDHKYDYITKPDMMTYWNHLTTLFAEQGFQLGLEEVNIGHVTRIFDSWYTGLSLPGSWKTDVIGRIYERLLFSTYTNREIKKARYCWLQLVRYRPKSLKNYGVITIGMEIFLGRIVTDWFRWLVRRIFKYQSLKDGYTENEPTES